MSDLRTRLRGADGVPAPDLWPDIATRAPRRPPSPSPWPRVAAGLVAAVVAVTASLLLVRSLPNKTPKEPVGTTPSRPTATSSFQPALKGNGKIAFLRTDPAIVQEGQIPSAALYVVEPDGTGLAKLIDLPPYSHAAWSPDGSKIAFSASGIGVMNADGGGSTTLTECRPPGCEGDSLPVWSPDGTRIAFSHFDGGADGLWLLDADGSDPRSLREGFVTISGLAWSPDGARIAVVGYVGPGPQVGEDQIYLVDAETGEITESIALGGVRVLQSVGWSPDGAKLVFDSSGEFGSQEGQGIYLIDADGSDLQLLTSCDAQPPEVCSVSYPAWSPDGRQVVFTKGGMEAGSDGSIGDLFVIDVQSREVRQLTGGPGLDCCPSWQPLPDVQATGCPRGISIVPGYLPQGFSFEVHAGPGPGAPPAAPGQTVVHYTDGAGRFVEIRLPGTPFVELALADDAPTVRVLGSDTANFGPIEPGGDRYIVQFRYPAGSPIEDDCALYSVNEYGLELPELIRVAEGLTSPSGVDAGEIQCEPVRPFTDNVDLSGARCLSIPRPNEEENLIVFLTPRGFALVVKSTDLDTTAEQFFVPVIPDLSAATLTVDDDGIIHVDWEDGRKVQIPTADW
jgi:TolB protein